MKKVISLLIAAITLSSIMIAVPVSAEESYKKYSVIRADVIMPDASEIAGIEGVLNYDTETLQYMSESLTAPHIPDIVYNTNKAGKILFNSSQANEKYNILSDHIIISVRFTVLCDISEPDLTSVIEDAYTLNGADFVDVPTDSEVIISLIREPSEATDDEATDTTDSTEATQAPETLITLTAAKTRIYVGAYTTVTANVINPEGNTVFNSSNTKVASVTAAGKLVGLKAGTVTVTAKNNGKSATIKIRIVRRANTIKAKAKANILKCKHNRKHIFKKTKAFKITGARGKVSFKKYKGSKYTAVSSSGNITVKKGAKKGVCTIKVKITAKGDTKYNSKTVIVKLRINVVK